MTVIALGALSATKQRLPPSMMKALRNSVTMMIDRSLAGHERELGWPLSSLPAASLSTAWFAQPTCF